MTILLRRLWPSGVVSTVNLRGNTQLDRIVHEAIKLRPAGWRRDWIEQHGHPAILRPDHIFSENDRR